MESNLLSQVLRFTLYFKSKHLPSSLWAPHLVAVGAVGAGRAGQGAGGAVEAVRTMALAAHRVTRTAVVALTFL